MPDDVWVLGVGVHPFGKYEGVKEADLVREAVHRALADSEVAPDTVQAVFFANVFGPPGLGQYVLQGSPFVGLPIVNLENACASASGALLEASAWVRAGLADVVLVVGVEVLTGRLQSLLPSWQGEDPYAAQGLTLPALYALKARYAMETYGTTAEQFALVTVKNRRHGSRNELARFQQDVTLEEVLASRVIAEPLTLLQCCANADGAAAAVVGSRAVVRDRRRAVHLTGSAIASGVRREEIGWEEETLRKVARSAYEQAGVGSEDIDVAEVHDAFTPGELMAYERLGFSQEGTGGIDLEDGRFSLGGGGPVINPSGGLLARGHPPGATGLAQLAEIVTQLRGEAGPRQVEGAKVGMTATLGGTVLQLETNACVCHVLTR